MKSGDVVEVSHGEHYGHPCRCMPGLWLVERVDGDYIEGRSVDGRCGFSALATDARVVGGESQ